MRSVLIYHADPNSIRQLQTDVNACGWSVDVCDRMLEMFRLMDKHEYEIVVLTLNPADGALSTLLGAIKALQTKPRIVLSLPEGIDIGSLVPLALHHPVIRGSLTGKKLLEAAQEER